MIKHVVLVLHEIQIKVKSKEVKCEAVKLYNYFKGNFKDSFPVKASKCKRIDDF